MGEGVTFDEWWARYPLKVAKADALKAWGQLAPGEELQDVLSAALNGQILWRARCAARREWVAAWPHGATWLRKRRWEDVVERAPELDAPIPKPERPSASIPVSAAPEPVKKPYPNGPEMSESERAVLLRQMRETFTKVAGRTML